MARIGYARVSTKGQKDDSQVDDLKAAGCEKIFTDVGVSGKLAARPELDKALGFLREGDVFVITRMSRAMRSLKHMIALAEDLRERGIDLVVLHQDIDTTTPTGRLVFHIMAAFDEFQRELIVEGTVEGLAAAKARGRMGGRKVSYTPLQAETARDMHAKKHTAEEIGQALGVSRATVYRMIKQPATEPAPATRKRTVAATRTRAK